MENYINSLFTRFLLFIYRTKELILLVLINIIWSVFQAHLIILVIIIIIIIIIIKAYYRLSHDVVT